MDAHPSTDDEGILKGFENQLRAHQEIQKKFMWYVLAAPGTLGWSCGLVQMILLVILMNVNDL